MPRAQCFYEILGVDQTASSDDIKKAYRNLALVWHPDKNQANPEEAHAKFQSILKAYETLSDSRERDWYDRHKDQILSGGDDDDSEKCLNLFQYFSSSCYTEYNDSPEGFYTVYAKVFDTIAEEESQARNQNNSNSKRNKKAKQREPDDIDFPAFGKSDSDYEDIVRPFYAFWSSFCTSLTFDHLDKYNTTEAENRRILKAMERENKRVKDQAKKERNANVRNLVEFVRKRDRRLKAHKLIVEQQLELNRQKTLEKQRLQREKCQRELSEYKPSVWDDMNDIEEQLKQLEDEYDAKVYGKKNRRSQQCQDPQTQESQLYSDEKSDDLVETEGVRDVEEDDEESEVEEEEFYCPACNKQFRSVNAFENHEASKKHKQNLTKLMKTLKNDEKKLDK